MDITAIKTHKITLEDKDIIKILDKYVTSLEDNSVLAISSKIISICQKRLFKIGKASKDDLVRKEAAYYLPRKVNNYNSVITIKNSLLIPAAGIDESNGNGYYILWPTNPQKDANKIRRYLLKRFGKKNIGVVITDSRTTFGRWGTTGISIGFSGFHALNNYIGKKDIFGKELKITKVNVPDSLAGTAVAMMGEGNEQTPLVIINNPPFVQFNESDPSDEELKTYIIQHPKDDLFGFIFQNAAWKKGEGF